MMKMAKVEATHVYSFSIEFGCYKYVLVAYSIYIFPPCDTLITNG